ncbi:hypothetical protein F4678DRAFT_483231 [Xylaria arbuscula]|nr:hypothetical protein F4678DRAFT_483231 [Xylaria arbuscula]
MSRATQQTYVTRPTCARVGCNSIGPILKACAGCWLVHYCSTACQKQAWSKHKSVCKSILFKAEPSSSGRNKPIRTPEDPPEDLANMYGIDASLKNESGTSRWLFDDMQPIDVLQLDNNEADRSDQPLNILFAGCGDMADFIKTIASLPMDAKIPRMRVVLNDKDWCLSTRNVAILLLAMTSDDPKATAELVVQLWYSAFMPIGYLDRILEQLEPYMKNSPRDPMHQILDHLSPYHRAALRDPVNMLRDPQVLARLRLISSKRGSATPKIQAPSPDENNKWRIRNCRLHSKSGSEVGDAFAFLRRPFNIGGNMLYPLRINQYYRALQRPWEESQTYWSRKMASTPREWRVSRKSYYEELVLLPFGHDRNADWAKPLKPRRPGPENTGNWVENPFYFGMLIFESPMSSFSDPLESWSVEDVAKNELAPKNDIYGKLFYYVRDMVEKFIVRLKSADIDMEVHHCDANTLRTELAGQQFDSIHTSSLADDQYMGVEPMLKSLSPLLKPKSINPCARLISLRREGYNVTKKVFDAFWVEAGLFVLIHGLDFDQLPPPELYTSLVMNHCILSKKQKEVVQEWEDQRIRDLNRIGAPLGVAVAENVLTTPWPFRTNSSFAATTLNPAVPFTTRNASSRYFEWQRTA